MKAVSQNYSRQFGGFMNIEREIFCDHAVRPTGFSLLRQHSLTHYPHQIREFGAPAELCSSITELQHIMAVKRPWRQSNHQNALGQMLLTNQRLDNISKTSSPLK